MPADDLVLNVRQIANYPAVSSAAPSDSVLLQRGGIGGPYASISPSALVSTALSTGGPLNVGGPVLAASMQAGSAQFSNAAVNLLSVGERATVRVLDAEWGTIAGVPIATTEFASALVAGLQASTVWSFNGRRGDVALWLQDVLKAGGAPIYSPRFFGAPMAPTPGPQSCNSRIATTQFVHRNFVDGVNGLLADHPFVFTFNGRTGDVVLTPDDIGNVEGALLNSPALQGTPTTPTPPLFDNSNAIANTEWVNSAVAGALGGYAPLLSPNFSGQPTAPTANPGTSTGQIATTAFVMAAVAESVSGVATWNGRTGNVTLEEADIVNAGGAPLNSPVFTGTPQAPTPSASDNSSRVATTAWVLNEIGGANIGVMSFNGRGGAVTLNTTDITGAGGAPIVSPALSGVPTAPTAAANTSTDQLATTAFVMSAVTVGSVASFNGRTGAVVLTANDVSAAGGLSNPSPIMTGSPTAPTASPGTNSTQVATTAFVAAAIIAAGGVSSFNTRSGAVTLQASDLGAAVGGPFLPLSGGTVGGALTVTGALTANGQANLNGVTQFGSAPYGIFDARGCLNIGPSALASPANAAPGTLFVSTIVGGQGVNHASNLYTDGTNWRYLSAAAGAVMAFNMATPSTMFQIYAYPSGAAGATATGTSILQLSSAGWLTSTNLTVNSGAIYLASGSSTILSMYGGSNIYIDGTYYGVGLSGPFQTTSNWRNMFIRSSGLRQWLDWQNLTLMSLASGGNLTISGTLSQASDVRTKRDVRPASEGMAQVRRLTPRHYRRVHGPPPKEHPGWAAEDREEFGFIAQEVETALPDAVHEGQDGTLTVELMALIAALTNSVKELDFRLAAMEARTA